MKTLMLLTGLMVLMACTPTEQAASTPDQLVAPAGAETATAEGASTEVAAGAAKPAAAMPGVSTSGLPRLVDLGATSCMPCKMMAPILDELRHEYDGRMEVIFIDVWSNREAGRAYGVNSIPTQVLYDAQGQERWRHVGFITKDDILAAIDEAGVEIPGAATE